jgi:hypothetical protein
MKPLLTNKVQRGNGTDPERTLNEWTSAESQATVDGLNAFAERQRRRIAEAAKLAPVTQLKRSKA